MMRYWRWLTETAYGPDPDMLALRFIAGPIILLVGGVIALGLTSLIITHPLVVLFIVALLLGGWTLGRVLFK